MFIRSFTALVALGLAHLAGARGAVVQAERNWWPLWVGERGQVDEPRAWQAGGPLLFHRPMPDGGEASGLRPLYLRRDHPETQTRENFILYPLFRHRSYRDGYTWAFWSFASGGSTTAGGGSADRRLDLYPVYFSRQTGDPATSYRAVFPLYGDVHQRFTMDRLQWILFPLYARFERNGVATTTAPWPFIKVLRGDGNFGVDVWPVAGHRAKAGVYREQFALWPLLYRQERHLPDGQRSRRAGFLPFYAVDRAPGYVSEIWGWPFWGYVHRTEPHLYHARHYFWPLWVQGRGDIRHVNRWAPFYTYSNVRGYEKTWLMWPLWRHATWEDSALRHERRQLLYFLYHSDVQRSATNPALAAAHKTHYWPLLTTWNNGAGRRQAQALSPFEVFFPHNEQVRLLWSPLVALYRFNQEEPGHRRHALLWNAVTYERHAAADTKEFRLGPLLSVSRDEEHRRIAIGHGLIGLRRDRAGGRWRLFFGDFRSRARPETDAASAPAPSTP